MERGIHFTSDGDIGGTSFDSEPYANSPAVRRRRRRHAVRSRPRRPYHAARPVYAHARYAKSGTEIGGGHLGRDTSKSSRREICIKSRAGLLRRRNRPRRARAAR